MEDRRRRTVAFVNLAKEMLRYMENSEEVKVGYHGTAGTIGGTCTHRYYLAAKWRSRRGRKLVKRCLKSFGKKRKSDV